MGDADTRLKTGSRVAVIGGGPAGSFMAMYLLFYAQQLGLQLDVTVFQDRDFDKPGPAGCKGCAGLLSLMFLRNLGDIGLRVPDTVIQHNIDDYAVYSPYSCITISNPEHDIQIVSVYRGGGPLRGPEPVQGFDAWPEYNFHIEFLLSISGRRFKGSGGKSSLKVRFKQILL